MIAGTLKSTSIINSGGGGTFTLTVSLPPSPRLVRKEEYSLVDVLSVVNLAPHLWPEQDRRKFQSKLEIVSTERRPAALYKLFTEELGRLSTGGFQTVWDEIFDRQQPVGEQQGPYVLVCAQLAKEQYEEVFLEGSGDLEVMRQNQAAIAKTLVAVLYRFVGPEWTDGISSDYVEKMTEGKARLSNINMHSCLFLTFGRILTLTIYYDAESFVTKTAVASVLNALELTRLHWFCCVVSSLRLCRLLSTPK
jgi:hypothetical protein